MLLRDGANLNQVDERGTTALMYAVVIRAIKAIEVLLKHGADPNQVDKNGWTPLAYAKSLKYTETIALFSNHKNK